jgi:hypothetical protein
MSDDKTYFLAAGAGVAAGVAGFFSVVLAATGFAAE